MTRWSGPSRNASSIASGDPGDRFVALASVQAIGGIPLSIDESEVFGRVALSPRQLLDVVDRGEQILPPPRFPLSSSRLYLTSPAANATISRVLYPLPPPPCFNLPLDDVFDNPASRRKFLPKMSDHTVRYREKTSSHWIVEHMRGTSHHWQLSL